MKVPPLTSYEQVVKLTESDRGASIPSLVRVSHIHVFGIAFILFFVGKLFILCEIPVWLKRLTIGVPFMSMLTDIFAWYLTRETPQFAYLLVLSGGLMGMSLNFQILLSLYQMWLPTAQGKHVQDFIAEVGRWAKVFHAKSAKVINQSVQLLLVRFNAAIQEGVRRIRFDIKKVLQDFVENINSRLPNDKRQF